jgi:hypothetical protein
MSQCSGTETDDDGSGEFSSLGQRARWCPTVGHHGHLTGQGPGLAACSQSVLAPLLGTWNVLPSTVLSTHHVTLVPVTDGFAAIV